jgi:serine protease Do
LILKPSDIITAVEGMPVSTAQQLRGEIRGKKIGQQVTLDVFRKGETVKIKLAPGEMPEPDSPAIVKASAPPRGDPTKLGLTVHVLTRELASQFGIEMTEGVLVMAVEKGTPAARQGIKPGDVITALNQKPVSNPKQFNDALKKPT